MGKQSADKAGRSDGLDLVRAYLEGKMKFDNEVIKRITFLDHLFRKSASKRLINLRRSYSARHAVTEECTLVGRGIEAISPHIFQMETPRRQRRLLKPMLLAPSPLQ